MTSYLLINFFYQMEYTGHSEKFYMEDESDCVGDVVSSDADEFDAEQLDPSGQNDVSDYGDVFGLTAAEIENKVFRMEERAYEFYMRFGKCHGFAVRKGDYGKDDDGNVIRRRFFCNRVGLRDEKHYNRLDRKRCHKPETRTNCQAKLSIYLDKESSNWKVRKVILEHNHELVARCMVHLIPKFRRVSGAAKDQLDGMQSYGLPTSKILGYMAGIAGGYSLLGFTKKDAYNYLDQTKHAKIADGDANSAIVYLEGKASVDPMAMARYNLTKEGMLANLFWADGMSRVDYQHFGDVIAFDSTYKKNKYRRPLVIFSGANNYKQTTIFGFGLVLDETIASYKWMLENFLEVMCNKLPSVVVTDGDDAIIAAVTEVFPSATHRLCAWHLQKNVTSNGNEKMFRDLFSRWLYADMSIDDFEAEWAEAADEYGLHDKLWAMQMYEKRKMWANAYLRDKFCARFRTTSRCEGINSHVKKFLSSKHTILELVQNLELVLREYRNNEMVAQFNSIYNVPVMTTCLNPIEKCAAMVYTRTIFTNVKKEIDAVGALNFVSKRRVSTTVVYTMEEYGNPGKPVVTLIDMNTTKLECRCNFCAKEGIPCRHIFFVMKHEHLKTIPHRLILKRWRKDVKAVEDYSEKKDVADDRGFLLQHGALHAAAQWLLFLSAQSHELFNVAMRGIRSMCVDMEGLCGDGYDQTNTDPEVGVRDPTVMRTKGAPSTRGVRDRKRRCTTCRRTGHTKRRCVEGFKKASVKLHDLEDDADVTPHKEKVPKGRSGQVDGEEGIAADCEFDRFIGTAQSETVKANACMPEGNWAIEVLDLLRSLHAHVEYK
ncbi:protein FAR1-RELATED SEQUENCE 5-like isoform X2 [Arachis ipaensis]|uniref:protein FAR1-RELATED SEQUENCE 5-like isoform X2 n=1 Tax=Arachis ipaensis TaxID=130454 RepID=UPI000A2B45A0|nr:protein FAR1-RELATED SEQUENCE 5-like isoform X2 [Arachis ipaensis]